MNRKLKTRQLWKKDVNLEIRDNFAYLSLADDLRAGLGDPGPLQRQLSGGWRPLQAQEVLTTVLDI